MGEGGGGEEKGRFLSFTSLPFSLPFFLFSPETPDTQARNKVKMLLTELNMLILQFVVLIFLFTIFTVLHIYKMFFFKHYNLQYLHCLRDAAGGG